MGGVQTPYILIKGKDHARPAGKTYGCETLKGNGPARGTRPRSQPDRNPKVLPPSARCMCKVQWTLLQGSRK